MVHVMVKYDGEVLIPDKPLSVPKNVLLDCALEELPMTEGEDPILGLKGLGADVWEDVDPVAYQRKEREGWA